MRNALFLCLLLVSCKIQYSDVPVPSGEFWLDGNASFTITIDTEAKTLVASTQGEETTYTLDPLPKEDGLLGCFTNSSAARTEAWTISPSTFKIGDSTIENATLSAFCGGSPLIYPAELAVDGDLDDNSTQVLSFTEPDLP